MPKDTIPARELKRREAGEKCLASRGFSLFYRPGKEKTSRLAVIIKKNFGLAVERNKARRRLKALFLKTRPCFKGRFDIIVIVRSRFKELSFDEIARDWLETLKRGGIIEKNCDFSN